MRTMPASTACAKSRPTGTKARTTPAQTIPPTPAHNNRALVGESIISYTCLVPAPLCDTADVVQDQPHRPHGGWLQLGWRSRR